MKKRVLLIGYNFSPEPTGIGKYSGEMMHWLAKNGCDCSVITTYPYYPYWQVQAPYTNRKLWYTKEVEHFDSGGQISVFRCPMYVPAQPSCLKRILLDLSFLASAMGKLLHLLPGKKFDIVLVVAPSFQFGLLGVLYKLLRNATFVYHIQDLQIEAARDLGMIKSAKAINLLLRIEKFILSKADVVSSVSESMVRKIQGKANKDVLLLPNWSDLQQFFPISDKAALKAEFGFAPTDKIVLYSGAIGAKQGLEAILYAAQEFGHQPDIKFVICGSGPYKKTLQQLADALQLANVIFFPLQPVSKFNAFLNVADVHLVIQKANASDLVMPSKLTTILAIGGLALITANENSGLHALVQKHEMGLLIPAENQAALNQGIQQALEAEHHRITANARAYAEKYLSLEKIMTTIEAAWTVSPALQPVDAPTMGLGEKQMEPSV
ncbi:WcaI family glycosyltransferase [Hymenobacter sp. HDW8]|uniref:WcaI family glycosyltransferase n=1 Tax=Hymenobacter sp. HDW8 TaxID=2714932 RepID=UPI00140CA3AE|nr:WcaI family glycosyltransferase [Hymenobacter sp. HDW8]QIL75330.1 WcaI family glycosyltransferase [Hymenobacter sp. HDW8]